MGVFTILTVLNLLTHEHRMSFHLFRFLNFFKWCSLDFFYSFFSTPKLFYFVKDLAYNPVGTRNERRARLRYILCSKLGLEASL